jgi:hypothetical protein
LEETGGRGLLRIVRMFVRAAIVVVVVVIKMVMMVMMSMMMTIMLIIITISIMIMTPNVILLPGTRDPRLGVLFIVLSCVVQGSQYVFEEKVMSGEGVQPMVLIGMEVR